MKNFVHTLVLASLCEESQWGEWWASVHIVEEITCDETSCDELPRLCKYFNVLFYAGIYVLLCFSCHLSSAPIPPPLTRLLWHIRFGTDTQTDNMCKCNISGDESVGIGWQNLTQMGEWKQGSSGKICWRGGTRWRVLVDTWLRHCPSSQSLSNNDSYLAWGVLSDWTLRNRFSNNGWCILMLVL